MRIAGMRILRSVGALFYVHQVIPMVCRSHWQSPAEWLARRQARASGHALTNSWRGDVPGGSPAVTMTDCPRKQDACL